MHSRISYQATIEVCAYVFEYMHVCSPILFHKLRLLLGTFLLQQDKLGICLLELPLIGVQLAV